MSDIEHHLRALPNQEIPQGLHGKIMRRIIFIRLRKSAIIMLSFLTLNLIILAWHIWTTTIERETFSVISAMFEGFEMSVSFFKNFADTLLQTVPVVSLTVFIGNIVVMVYIIYLTIKFPNLSEFITKPKVD